MSQTDEPQKQKLARTCSQCGNLYERSIAFCPVDGNRLSENLIATERMLLHVSEFDTGEQAEKKAQTGKSSAPIQARLSAKFSGDDLLGTTIDDRYELQTIIGSGGMSIVYRALDISLKKILALKMLLPHMMLFPMAFHRFQQEAQAASNLSHPNIVTIYGFGAPSGHAYIVMDYLEGRSLSSLLEDNKHIAIDHAVHIFIQVADALSHAHSKGVIHRDLKPSNILLVQSGSDSDFVKIVDFGIAKLLNQEGPEAVRLTQTGEIFGSPIYMSPEQCKGEKLDARADIYSLGCLMYETLVGTPPNTGNTTLEVLYKHIHTVPAPMSRDDIKIPQRLERIIFKALAKDPAERYQNMQALRKDLISFSKERKLGIFANIQDKFELFWLKRRPKTVHEQTIASVCAVLTVVVVGLGSWICHLYWTAANSPANKVSLDWQETIGTIDVPDSELQATLLKVPIIQSQENPMERLKGLFSNDGIFMRAGRYHQAIDRFLKDYQLSQEINGEDAFYTTLIEDSLAECYFRVGEFDKAKTLYDLILPRSRKMPLPTKMLANAMFLNGEIYRQREELLAAEREYKHSISLWNDHKDQWTVVNVEHRLQFPETPPSDEFTLVVARLADIDVERKDYAEAGHLYGKVIQYCDSTAKSAPADVAINSRQRFLIDTIVNDAIAHDRLAKVEMKTGSKEKAVANARLAVQLMEKAKGFNNIYTGLVLRDSADTLWSGGDFIGALFQQYRALNIFAKAE